MRIDEAEKRWGIKSITICKYIVNGWIDCLKVNGNEIILPDIPKPMKISCKNYDDSRIMEYIIKACDNNQYLSSYMLGISGEHFERLLECLVSEGYLTGKSECGFSNIGYHVTAKKFNRNIQIINNINVENNANLIKF